MSGRIALRRDAGSRGWLRAFTVALAACVSVLAANVLTDDLDPGGRWGLSYGIAAAVLLVALMVYPARRRSPRLGPGRMHHWLHFHMYGGVVFAVLVLMHTGFGLPTGMLPWSLWLISLWLVISGLAGRLLQRWLPRALTSGLTTEVHYDRIFELVDAIRQRAEELVRGSEASIGRLYRAELAPLLRAPRANVMYFVDVTGGITSQLRQLERLRRLLGDEHAERVTELESLVQAKLEIDAHYTLQRALRWWLVGHVPFSIVLVVLVGWHVFGVLYY